jgi:hypothetical protein
MRSVPRCGAGSLPGTSGWSCSGAWPLQALVVGVVVALSLVTGSAIVAVLGGLAMLVIAHVGFPILARRLPGWTWNAAARRARRL